MSSIPKTFTKRTFRDRYYSSMDYHQYYLLFGPPTPIVKPLDTPTEDIPQLSLESDLDYQPYYFQYYRPSLTPIDQTPRKNHQSSNDDLSHISQKLQPSKDQFVQSTIQTLSKAQQFQLSPKDKIVRQRPRSKSDNSDYLIFSFLQRINKMGKKKVKVE